MSFNASTSDWAGYLANEPWAGYVERVKQMPASRWAILALVNAPVLAILFNALWQKIAPRKATDPPVVFHWLPIIGSAIWYGNDPIGFFQTCQERYGDVFTCILLGRKVTVTLGVKGSNFVLGGKSTAFNAEGAYTHLTTPVFGKDVVYDCPNEVFMQQKKFIKFGLTTKNFPRLREDDRGRGGRIYAQGPKEKEVREGLNKSFSQLYSDLDGGFTPLNFLFANLPLESYRKRDRAQKKMSDFYVDIIKRRRANPDAETHYDMIESLKEQTYRGGAALRDHEIAHLMIALLMAGQHTSTATLAWTVLHLASRPDVAAALYQEQVERFGNADGSFRAMEYEDLRHLPVLDSVIRETLRVHPPIHNIMRQVREDVPVPASLAAPSSKSGNGVYVVPKDTYVLASPIISQLDPRIWVNAHTWEPSRWSDSAGVAAQALRTYTDEAGEKIDYGFGAVSKGTESPYQPFGAGRHRCIGEQFAYLQIGTIVAALVRRVELRLPTKVPEHNYHTLILMPKDPKSVHYRRRRFD
ncbi:Lanosterol 14-alpha-demethylase [Mycena sanguinolenta]|uniref:Lanosterol 14-alpha-demethylase n=1 Tax=Mycena sanguinolenta TaxID=230812 RepID=A0A8H6U320_9AGAR|nr:Lanosterol 14-alpha-demethylase [Mycena sanguinolenta]